MSNFDHSIDNEIKEAIEGKKLFSQYTGWNFCANVWYEDNKWYCEVWQYKRYKKSMCFDTLEEMMEGVCKEFGDE